MKKILLTIIIIMQVAIFISCSSSNIFQGTIFEGKVKNNVYLNNENVGGLKTSQIEPIINQYASGINAEPKNAVFDSSRWELIQKEQVGKTVNIKKTIDAVLNSSENSVVNPVIDEKNPDITSSTLTGKIMLIGSFATPLLDRQDSRINNIELAVKNINYKILKPGEVFSFNAMLGSRTQDKGYEFAPIIVKTENGYEKGYGVGGGICQVSSTIYNAAASAGLEIIERHQHSKDVGYVPLGRDATVSFGNKDFKFKNSKSFPIMVRVYLSSNDLSVKIFENRN